MTIIQPEAVPVSVLPIASVGSLTKSWAIFDPVGSTTAELGKLGFTADVVQATSDLTGYDVLVVGAKALNESFQMPATAADVAAGLRVVIFEQSAAALQAMGFRTDDIMPRYAFPRVTDHPVLSLVEVKPEYLINWRGQGQLTPETKRNSYLYHDGRMHWKNRGSVASVVIETPHSGAFTPIVESSFDLSFSPLLEWRHGAGTVVFCQLDMTYVPSGGAPGRIRNEPAADLLATNLVRYLDGATLYGPDAHRTVAFVGSDIEDAKLMSDLGFAQRDADPASLALQTGELVVIGRGVTLTQAARDDLAAHVRAGGVAVYLPRKSPEINGTPVGTSAQTLTRVLPEVGVTALTRGIGPQLTRWRTHLSLDVITANGMPTGGIRLRGGLLGELPDGSGTWVVSQFDWRGLYDPTTNVTTNNTRRPRWNARKFYRQLLTNLGAKSKSSTAAGLLPAESRAPLKALGEQGAAVGKWLAVGGTRIGPTTIQARGGWMYATMAGMDTEFAKAYPGGGAVVAGHDVDNYIELKKATSDRTVDDEPFEGATAHARTYVYSSGVRPATIDFGPAYWGTLKVNGQMIHDDSVLGCVDQTTGIHPPTKYGVTLNAGWNKLEITVATARIIPHYGQPKEDDPVYAGRPAMSTGSLRKLGFTFRIDDPGDLIADPYASGTPSGTPAYSVAPIDFYMEAKPRPEDVYHYHSY